MEEKKCFLAIALKFSCLHGRKQGDLQFDSPGSGSLKINVRCLLDCENMFLLTDMLRVFMLSIDGAASA